MKQDCQCKRANHQHGTRNAYVVDKCRCDDCTTAATDYERARRRAIVYGRYDVGRVDADPVRTHIRYLQENGVSVKRTAQLTGLSTSTVGSIIWGRHERGHDPYPRVFKETAEKILAVKPTLENMAHGHVIDGIGTGRRLQALVAIGWSQSRLGERLGIAISNMQGIVIGKPVTVGKALAVKALFDELWNQPQMGADHRSKIAANRARNYAQARGWLPPMAWDEDTIDDPTFVPDLQARNDPSALIEDVEFLVRTGVGLESILSRTGYKKQDSLERLLHRAGRGDLIFAMKRGLDLGAAA